jgi:hypothetical protein
MRTSPPLRVLAGLLLAPALAIVSLAAQSSVSPEDALKRASENEKRVKAAEADYDYKQDILVQTFGEAKSITGQMRRVSELTYDDLGNRVDRIIEYPPSRLTMALGVQKPDFKSLLGVDPFFLTPDNMPKYSIKFVEKQKIDELNTYVFEVDPASRDGKRDKKAEDRPFKGRIWIDDQDFQIVKVDGRAVTTADDKERFPKFEYYREFVGNMFWLPSYVLADDVLEFKRYDVPIKIVIKYSDYRKSQRRKTEGD